MDRRDALKKMAVGGAAVAGATAVMSSPAFAYSQPVSAIPPTVQVIMPFSSWRQKITLQVTAGTASCAASSVSPGNNAEFIGFSVNDVSATFNPATSGGSNLKLFYNPGHVSNNYLNVPNPAITTSGGSIQLIKKRDNNSGHNGSDPVWIPNDRLKFTVKQSFKCVYASGESSIRTFTYSNYQWQRSNNGNSDWKEAQAPSVS